MLRPWLLGGAALALALALAGCTINVNNPNVSTAVGDGARIGGDGLRSPAPGAAPTAAPTAGATARPSAAPSDAAPADPVDAGVRDQQALKTSMAVEASRDAQIAQVFVPGRDGAIATVGVRLAYRGEQAPAAVLRLYRAADGGPAGEPLAEAALPQDELSTDRDERWIAARFDPAVPVEAGARYAWAVVVTGAFPLVAGAGDNRSYEAGEGYTAGRPGSVWSRAGLDFAFRTYLTE